MRVNMQRRLQHVKRRAAGASHLEMKWRLAHYVEQTVLKAGGGGELQEVAPRFLRVCPEQAKLACDLLRQEVKRRNHTAPSAVADACVTAAPRRMDPVVH